MTFQAIIGYPGVGIAAENQAESPFWKGNLIEVLGQLAGLKTGKKLLKAIGSAQPEYVKPGLTPGENVRIYPLLGGAYLRQKPSGEIGPNEASPGALPDKMKAALGRDGVMGSTVYVNWSNSAAILMRSQLIHPAVVLGHELIHALHFLTGTGRQDYMEEEMMTIGFGTVDDVTFDPEDKDTLPPLCDNRLRWDLGIARRTEY